MPGSQPPRLGSQRYRCRRRGTEGRHPHLRRCWGLWFGSGCQPWVAATYPVPLEEGSSDSQASSSRSESPLLPPVGKEQGQGGPGWGEGGPRNEVVLVRAGTGHGCGLGLQGVRVLSGGGRIPGGQGRAGPGELGPAQGQLSALRCHTSRTSQQWNGSQMNRGVVTLPGRQVAPAFAHR